MWQKRVKIIGGGLAGCEAAHQIARRGIAVDLFEMRPKRQTEAHQSGSLAELVCSNSFKSRRIQSGPGILKQEMQQLGSVAIESALKAQIDAGEALAVDRDVFAAAMTEAIKGNELITVHHEPVETLSDEDDCLTIVATGPLTSEALANELQRIGGEDQFYFYDAIAPIIDASSIDYDKVFIANRWDKGSNDAGENTTTEGEGDYINCPFNKDEYEAFIDALLAGEKVTAKNFERLKHFEGCMPVESIAERGRDSLRFGPMRPVGLRDPRTGRRPWAVVQLRTENAAKDAYNLVGFQTKLKYGEQKRIFQMIPGLENAEFMRLGSMHRNSFINSPEQLNHDLSFKKAPHLMAAGQLTGVEGYMESAAIGLLAGIFASHKVLDRPVVLPPQASALGALLAHLRNERAESFQPMSMNFSLFNDDWFAEELKPLREQFRKKLPKNQKREILGLTSIRNCKQYSDQINA